MECESTQVQKFCKIVPPINVAFAMSLAITPLSEINTLVDPFDDHEPLNEDTAIKNLDAQIQFAREHYCTFLDHNATFAHEPINKLHCAASAESFLKSLSPATQDNIQADCDISDLDPVRRGDKQYNAHKQEWEYAEDIELQQLLTTGTLVPLSDEELATAKRDKLKMLR